MDLISDGECDKYIKIKQIINFGMTNPFLIKVILIAILIVLIPTVMALIDISKNKYDRNDKMVWVFVVLFFNIIGVMIYFAFGRKQKIKL